MADWRRYHRTDKRGTAPVADEMVWVTEDFYNDGEVTIGFFDGFTFRILPGGSDDCSVSWWAPIEYPEKPGGDRDV